MKLRTGCDIVHIPRFKKILKRTPAVADKIFLAEERAVKNPEELAGVFAAKESVMKALGIPAGSWLSVLIKKEKSGKPFVTIKKPHAVRYHTGDISISHDGDYAVAFAVFII